MADNSKLIMLDPKNEKQSQEDAKQDGHKKIKYLIYAVLIFVAVFIYDVSPLDLMPLLPFDDIAVTGGGLLTILSLIRKYRNKAK